MMVPVETANEVALVPPATTIEAGRLKPELSLESETAMPDAGAEPDKVNVHVLESLELSEVGRHDRESTTGVATRETPVLIEPAPINAVRVTCWLFAIVPVEILKEPEFAPEASVTVEGTFKFAVLLKIVTGSPPLSAIGRETVMVQEAVACEPRVAGRQLRDCRVVT